MSNTRSAWLFVRGPESVRIVMDGTSVGVYGPGSRVSQTSFEVALEATLHQAALEQTLVFDGWTLERLTTERRHATQPERSTADDRRRSLALVAREPDIQR